jgi:hypothetical protein
VLCILDLLELPLSHELIYCDDVLRSSVNVLSCAVIVACASNSTITVWDLSSLKCVQTLEVPGGGHILCLTELAPNSTHSSSGSGGVPRSSAAA